MGVNAEFQVPVIEFRTSSSDLERGTKGWHHFCERVREACENYGCFQVVYEGVSRKVRDDTFCAVKQLVDEVPLERKQRMLIQSLTMASSDHAVTHLCTKAMESTRPPTMTVWKALLNLCGLMVTPIFDEGAEQHDLAPPPGWESGQGLHSHSDKPVSTIICDDLVSGLEIEVGDGQWIKLSSSPSSFFFVVGDPLLAWSNGRMKAVNHRVTMSGDKDRFL
ncbi:hypothetical protein F3Y22_tig00018568pilonHSYRG00039 [Hibiscus syriacus]|uniref:Fe2OG dioxygenase domain-containing protein n=1 Tax=Hibiscus syriacus TaxID=106335 RepID=A0A6A3BXP4_HIBSY|nr:hypothetical protein F3Y22_tig00018568pilonHSYRG00039 [Hibiscus syriacus]